MKLGIRRFRGQLVFEIGLTIYIQADSPGADKQANWLSAPKGPFKMAARDWACLAIVPGCRWSSKPRIDRAFANSRY
jgi:hypothetical protein